MTMDQIIEMIWKSWYGDEKLELTFPRDWKVEVAKMEDAPDVGDVRIGEAFRSPVGTRSITELAHGRNSAVIVVDDLSRPTQTARILPFIIRELKKGGIPASASRVIMALGAHRPMNRQDYLKKLGKEIVENLAVYNHCPHESLVDLGRSSRGTPVKISRLFFESDLRIGVGCVLPHGGAGFGGGGKIILPGIAGIETLEANHRRVTVGTNGKSSGEIGVVEGNENRADIEEIARKAGLDIVVNIVTNSTRGIAGICVGDMVEAHRRCVDLALKVYSTEVPRGVDIGIFNAYPKDTDLIQAPNAFNIHGSSTRDIVREGGTLVVVTASTEGKGYHSLQSRGMRLHMSLEENAIYRRIIKNKRIIIFSPNINLFDIEEYWPKGTLLIRKWTDVIEELRREHRDRARVAVFPCASIQLPKIDSYRR